jgi:hypothetical protein
MRLAGVEPPRIDLGDVRDQLGFDTAGVSKDLGQPAQQLVVRE